MYNKSMDNQIQVKLPEPIKDNKGYTIDAWFIDPRNQDRIHVVAQDNERILSNGARFSMTTNRITSKPITSLITSDKSYEYKQLIQGQTKDAIIEAICSNGGKRVGLRKGIKLIAQAQVEIAREKSPYSTKAADWLLKTAGLLENEDNKRDPERLVASLEQARALIQEIESRVVVDVTARNDDVLSDNSKDEARSTRE